MLKKFFVSMLGTMAGLWLSLIIFVIIGFMAFAVLIAKSTDDKGVSDNSVLYVDLTGNISDRESQPSISDIMSYVDETSCDLETLINAIRIAKNDKDIKGIYINCGGSTLGYASRGELIDALSDFKKSGKWIYAYGDEIEQGDFYVASVADSLYLNPVGSLSINGLSSTTLFFKDVLDKLGVDVEVVRVGSFKSAVEPFLRMDMSPESRMQTSLYLNQIWSVMTETMAKNQGLNTDTYNICADSLSFTWSPDRYLSKGIISGLKYKNEFENQLRTKLNIKEDDELPLVKPDSYVAYNADKFASANSDHIAVLYAIGDIVQSGDGISSESMVPEIERLAKDKKVKGLVLRVNSPGGSAFASEQIWHALEEFKATGKPFYVSMGDYAASGGYYISSGAQRIFCDPSTLTGSIGIFGLIPNAQKLLQQKIGLGIGTVSTSPNANFPNFYTAPTAQQVDGMQKYVERGYETFTSRVAQGRDISVDSVKVIGGGRVWDGVSALKIGLVDELGGLEQAISAMAEKTGLDADKYVAYPKIEATMLETLIKESKKNIHASAEAQTLMEAKEYYDYAAKIRSLDPLQARMPKIVIK